MADSYLRAADVISGQEGMAYATIDGQVESLFMVRSMRATVEKQKEDIRTLGRRGIQSKAAGWKGTGEMTAYNVTSMFLDLVHKYAKNGVDTYFTIIIENNDPTSTIGTQTVALYNCNIDSTVIAALDVDTTALDFDASFTFDDFDPLSKFTKPSNM